MTAKVAKESKRGSAPGERRGGRQKGTPNKKNAAVIEAAKAGGLMPLDYMLAVLRDEGQEEVIRRWAAQNAAPYLHAKLTSNEHGGTGGGPVIVEIVKFSDLSD